MDDCTVMTYLSEWDFSDDTVKHISIYNQNKVTYVDIFVKLCNDISEVDVGLLCWLIIADSFWQTHYMVKE